MASFDATKASLSFIVLCGPALAVLDVAFFGHRGSPTRGPPGLAGRTLQ